MTWSVIKPKLQKRYEQKCILNFTSLRVELNLTFYSSSVRNTSLTTYNNVIAFSYFTETRNEDKKWFFKGLSMYCKDTDSP